METWAAWVAWADSNPPCPSAKEKASEKSGAFLYAAIDEPRYTDNTDQGAPLDVFPEKFSVRLEGAKEN